MTGRTWGIAAMVCGFVAWGVCVPAAGAGTIGDVVGQVNGTVEDTVGSVTGTGGGGGGGAPIAAPAPAPAPAAPAPAAAEGDPPLSEDGPYGSGEVVGADVTVLPSEGDEVTVGDSTGEQDEDGDYHGRVIPVAVLGLGIAVIETDEGESASSPLAPVNDVLDEICAGSGNNVCLSVLEYESSTDDDGSQNSFSAARAGIGDGAVTAGVVESEGNISETDRCQTAEGSSSAADVDVGEGALAVGALQSSSSSQACRGEDPEAAGDSEVLDLGALDALDPLELIGCSSTEEDDEFGLPLLVDGVCNADDTNGSQAEAPYNTRKAFGIDILPGLAQVADVSGLAGLDAASAESRARAPRGSGECPDPSNPACDGSDDDECVGQGCPDEPGSGSKPESAGPFGPGDDTGGPSAGDQAAGGLPFTGADVGFLALVGLGVAAGGLALMGLADRRRGSSV